LQGFWPPWGVEHLTPVERFVKTVNAGVDQIGGLNDPVPLLAAVQPGLISEARVDAAIARERDLLVVDAVTDAEIALVGVDSPFEVLHPWHAIGSQQQGSNKKGGWIFAMVIPVMKRSSGA